jgi:uncharacterized membrane protein YfcA
VIEAGVLGVGAGLLSGLFGVGGGILFVPALILAADLSQVRAEATSLLAIVPVAALGAWRQHRYGNVDLRAAALLGLLSGLGVLAGVALANALPQGALRKGFAVLALGIAGEMSRRSIRSIRARRAA